MGGAEFDAPPFALLVLDEAGGVAALAAVTAGSDLRPSEYPSAKNSAHTPTRPKNNTSSFPVPSVISVSSEAAITYLHVTTIALPFPPAPTVTHSCTTANAENYAVFPGTGLSSPGFPRIF